MHQRCRKPLELEDGHKGNLSTPGVRGDHSCGNPPAPRVFHNHKAGRINLQQPSGPGGFLHPQDGGGGDHPCGDPPTLRFHTSPGAGILPQQRSSHPRVSGNPGARRSPTVAIFLPRGGEGGGGCQEACYRDPASSAVGLWIPAPVGCCRDPESIAAGAESTQQ